MTTEQEIWDTLHRHLSSIFNRDLAGYEATTSADLSLYEWYVTPHRLDGLEFHQFMNQHHGGDGQPDEDSHPHRVGFRYDLLEPRLQVYGEHTAIVSYTFMLTKVQAGQVSHSTHNESRVLIKMAAGWQVVHVHKSPTWAAPKNP